MNTTLRRSISMALVVCAAIPMTASATNGYFAHGWGTKSKAMAGVATALPQDTLVSATNPAGMAFVGNSLDLGVAFFNPSDRGYEANADFTPPACPTCLPPDGIINPGTFKSDIDWFAIPSFGYNREIDSKSTIGVSVFGNGGMNTKYTNAPWQNFAAPPNGLLGPVPGQPAGTLGIVGFDNPPPVAPNNANPFGALSATRTSGVNLEQLFIEVPYTYKMGERQSIGIAPVFALQNFEAKGLQPFRSASLHPDKLTNNGKEWSYGFGLHVGWFGQITDTLDGGISYRTQTWMTDFDDYEGLFANGGDFDIPPMLNVGVAYKARPNVTVAFDYQRIFYDEIDAIANSNNVDLTACQRAGQMGELLPDICLGGRNGVGFGWDSLDILKLGVLWDVNQQWTLRAGASWNSDFIEGKQALFNVLAPATVKYHFTVGATYRHNAHNEFNLSYSYMPKETIDGTSPSITGTQTGNIFMEQQDIEVSWTYRF